ncbi:MAG TPA: transposase [Aggregatilineaceae bacterium]|nr:transposase [Aggregatilineaceae bacterium]
MSQAVVGIDVSKAKVDVLLRRDESDAGVGGTFDNRPSGFKKLAQWLSKRQPEPVHACLEATGTYGDEVARFLHEAGHTVSVVNPAQIKKHAESQLRRNKTDALDAAVIADFCLKHHPRPWTPPDPAWYELRALARHLTDLKDMRQQERNRLKSGVKAAGVVKALEDHLAFLDQQIHDLEREIQHFIDQHPDLKQRRDLIDSIPGFSDLTAALLVAEIPYLTAFEEANDLVAFAGLNPRLWQSGTLRGHTPLSKIGNAAIRRHLYFPALSAQRFNPILAPWAAQLLARGKAKMEVVGAVMRRLLILVYGVLKSGQPFDPHWADRRASP